MVIDRLGKDYEKACRTITKNQEELTKQRSMIAYFENANRTLT